jgi:hypothetical protein
MRTSVNVIQQQRAAETVVRLGPTTPNPYRFTALLRTDASRVGRPQLEDTSFIRSG